MEEMLEIVQIIVSTLSVFGNRYEKANQEHSQDQNDESDGVFERSPKPLAQRLISFLSIDFVILFMPEVGEGKHEEAQQRIKRVESIVDNFQSLNNVIDLVLCSPVFSASKL